MNIKLFNKVQFKSSAIGNDALKKNSIQMRET